MAYDVIDGPVQHLAEQHVKLLGHCGVEVDLAAAVADLHGDVANDGQSPVALDGLGAGFGRKGSTARHTAHDRLRHFGTGYSSLSYLRQFPVDILKIDRSFISTITDRTKIPAIVCGLLDLGRTLELETVAEGVEDDIQRDSLRDQNCDLAQGYLFARPLDPIDAEALLEQIAGPRAADLRR